MQAGLEFFRQRLVHRALDGDTAHAIKLAGDYPYGIVGLALRTGACMACMFCAVINHFQ